MSQIKENRLIIKIKSIKENLDGKYLWINFFNHSDKNRLITLINTKKIKDGSEIIDFLIKNKINYSVHSNEKLIDKKKVKDCLEIIDFLNKNNIDYVVLKGLTLKHFNKKRTFGDLDIFVDKRDVKKIIKLLTKKFNYTYDIDYFNYIKKINFKNDHHIQLKHTRKICIEVHYLLSDYSTLDTKSLNMLSNKIFFNINGIKIPYLSPELQLLVVTLHNAYQHVFLTNYQKWLDDTNIILNSYKINWSKFIKIISKLGYSELTYRSFILLNNFNKSKIIPLNILRKIYLLSSKWRLFLTRKFDINFFKKNKSLLNKIILSEKKKYEWRLKNVLLFNLGFNKQFLNMIYYDIFFKHFFPRKNFIVKKFKIKFNSKFIYLFYIINWFRILLIEILWKGILFNFIKIKEK